MADIACAFTLREVDKVNTVLDSLVCYFIIEFLPNTPNGQPSVAFRLKTLLTEEYENWNDDYPPIYRVCRISMEHTRSLKGEIEIELLPDVVGGTKDLAAGVPAFDLSAAAMAAFYFKVRYPPKKLGQWLYILEGRYDSLHTTNLTCFEFIWGNGPGRSRFPNVVVISCTFFHCAPCSHVLPRY